MQENETSTTNELDIEKAEARIAQTQAQVAAGLGTMLKLNTDTIYQAIQQALHTTISTRQSRKGEISSWKAYAPAHAGKLAIEAVDRAMRGEGAPSPIYEGENIIKWWDCRRYYGIRKGGGRGIGGFMSSAKK